MQLFRQLLFAAFALIFSLNLSAQKQYKYESVEDDPLKARIYTLDNGLKIYLTVNKDEPRIQTYIAVRVGGKNDPAETTGLAHYFEHLMFKGTTSFGTWNYAAEKPLLDSIEAKFETYRHTTDSLQRKAIYHQIDSISYEASKYAIANEYDKMMAQIGAEGTNAYTSEDVTCYIEDIPSNEIDNWAKIEADRFKDNVIRGFHTELEAVYEEKNISLTRDEDKWFNGIMSALFPHHPYGTQTILGTQEHLKNPSITNIKKYYSQWYVPNNIAICMSGDLDMDSTVAIIDKYFGDWKANDHLPVLKLEKEQLLIAPIHKDVYGPEADEVIIGWRFPGKKEKEYDLLKILSLIIYNDKVGLFDVNLNQQQKVLTSGSFDYGLSDYSMFLALAYPKEGQTLDEVKNLMLTEINKVANGEFEESLLTAIINNIRLDKMKELENNDARANQFVEAFINRISWEDKVKELDRLSNITKQDIVSFAKEYLTEGYACVYKHKGIDPDEKKMNKPEISPIEMNREKTSDFVKNIYDSEVKPIEPVFVDYNKDMSIKDFKNGDELLYKKNTENETFSITYIYKHGSKNDRELATASSYIDVVGTKDKSIKEIKKEMYEIACSGDINIGSDQTTITFGGLAENMDKCIKLFEEWLFGAVADSTTYKNFVDDEIKSREMSKLEQESNFTHLRAWGMFGAKNELTNILSEEELKDADPQAILDRIKDLRNYKQTILYYGPNSEDEVLKIISKHHKMASNPIDSPEEEDFKRVETTETEIYIAPYEAKNIYMTAYSNNGQIYDSALVPQITMFNTYFGDNMSSIVFQEIRESRGLAYSASAWYSTPSKKGDTDYFNTFVITQNDKMKDCIETFTDIIENMPLSQTAFPLAKEAILKRLSTQRIIKANVLNSFYDSRKLGLDHDINEDIYNQVKTMTLDDVFKFQNEYIKKRNYKYLILGDENELDMDFLKKVGPIHRLTTEEIFGY